jgi:hypothetical protein
MLQLLRVVCVRVACIDLHRDLIAGAVFGNFKAIISRSERYRRDMLSLFSLVLRDIFLNMRQISLFELPCPMDYHECQH